MLVRCLKGEKKKLGNYSKALRIPTSDFTLQKHNIASELKHFKEIRCN